MKKRNYYFILLLISVFYKGQVQDDYLYFLDKATNILYNNPDESLIFTQNLIINDKNPDHQIAYRNIIAQSYALKGDYQNAVKFSLENEDFKKEEITPFQQFYLDYSLADHYQNLSLFKQSQKTIFQILQKQKLPKNPETQITVGKLFQLQAINFLVAKNDREAFIYFKKSDSALVQNNQEVHILKTENQLFRALIYTNQNRMSEAKFIFDQVNQSKVMLQSKFIYALARESEARMYFLEQNPQKAILLLEDALKKIENIDYSDLHNKIYGGLAKAYLAEKNLAKYHHYRDLHNKTAEKLSANRKSAINFLVNIKERIDQVEIAFYTKKTQKTTQYIFLFAVLVLLGFTIFYLLTFRKEKELHQQIDFFEHQFKRKEQEKNVTPQESTIESPLSVPSELRKTPMLSPEKENELLEKLQEFENSQLYLSNQMSLPLLASEFGTNIKYLSEIIREKKNKKFNSYINHLRIQYIVNQLQSDPAYLKYKVSHLADITGFSSHSAFTSVFKAITGMSPNQFIQQLQIKK